MIFLFIATNDKFCNPGACIHNSLLVSESSDAFESVTGVETDVGRSVQLAVVVIVYVVAIGVNALLLLATCQGIRLTFF